MEAFARRMIVAITWLAFESTGPAQQVDLEPQSQVPNDDTVLVIGRKPDRTMLNRPGVTAIYRGNDERTSHWDEAMREDSQVVFARSSEVSASGFQIPRMRGYDSRQSELFLDDLLIQDPHLYFPLLSDLDLRAFGRLEVHTGLPPPELPSANPAGTLNLHTHLLAKVIQSGLSLGQPFGRSSFLKVGAAETPDGLGGLIYMRQHYTSGRFSFLNDHGTPYNPGDDTTSIRSNNDGQSRIVFPTLTWQRGDHRFTGFYISTQNERGLPTQGESQPNLARTSSRSQLSSLKWQTDFETARTFQPSQIRMGLALGDDQRQFEDDQGSLSPIPQSSSLNIQHQSWSGSVRWEHLWALNIHGSLGQSRVLGTQNVLESTHDVKREVLSISIGNRIPIYFHPRLPITIEPKLIYKQFIDRKQDQKVTGALQSWGVSTSIGPKSWQLHGQLGHHSRWPSLLETFGDSGFVQSNPDLPTESIIHVEMGGRIVDINDRWHLLFAGFNDSIRNRLSLVQASQSTLKAQNLGDATLQGFTLDGRTELTQSIECSGSLTRIVSEKVTDHKALPDVPDLTGSGGITWTPDPMSFRWLTRRHGTVWRDANNFTEVPGHFIHDLYMSYKWTSPTSELNGSIQFAVLNVLDLQSLDLSSSGQPNGTGQTSLSDGSGQPQPGRNWRVSAEFRL